MSGEAPASGEVKPADIPNPEGLPRTLEEVRVEYKAKQAAIDNLAEKSAHGKLAAARLKAELLKRREARRNREEEQKGRDVTLQEQEENQRDEGEERKAKNLLGIHDKAYSGSLEEIDVLETAKESLREEYIGLGGKKEYLDT